MAGRMGKKLRSSRGDSIGEVLIAVLIAAFALLMLAGMINASGKLITNSKAAFDDYYEESGSLVAQEDGDETLRGTATLTGGGAPVRLTGDELSLNIYENGEGIRVYSYRLRTGEETARP